MLSSYLHCFMRNLLFLWFFSSAYDMYFLFGCLLYVSSWLVFSNVIIMSVSVIFSCFLGLSSVEFLGYFSYFLQFWNIFGHYLLKYFFLLTHICLLSSGTPITWLSGCIQLSYKLLRLWSLLSVRFSLCFILNSFYFYVILFPKLFFCSV